MRMRIKYYQSVYGGIVIVILFLSLYLMSESLNLRPDYNDRTRLRELETKLTHLEQELKSNELYISKLQHKIKSLVEKPQEPYFQDVSIVKLSPVNRTVALVSKGDCDFGQKIIASPELQVLNIYDTIKFDNPDGGHWKQGWEISYPEELYSSSNKLKVIVVPHSHNDPGWIKTFEKYFQDQTLHILNSAVNSLSEKSTRKFIWAEVSFLSLWWEEVGDAMREKLKRLLDGGQLEIVTGGWVMTDEANSHYYAMLEQLISGHEWLTNTLGIKPGSGWAIDPFGLTSTMPYLLRRSGLTNLVVQRVHYSVKKFLAHTQQLEFLWRQHWDNSTSTELFTHIMPFYSYDVPHTCGPDPKVCCQFDFKRMPPFLLNCPWGIPPQEIEDYNIELKSALLVDQYKKKAQLFKTNVVLVPLGDDFRYQDAREWDAMMRNYEKLMRYINNRSQFGAQIQFGTLSDYFSAVEEEIKAKDIHLPSLTGDFFTYADRDDHYWSGYYTTRPFYKGMCRILENYLRSAEILYSLMQAQMNYFSVSHVDMMASLFRKLVRSRRNLALFQHHDGITGTAKTHVVKDYALKMLEALKHCQFVTQQAVNFLLQEDPIQFSPDDREEYFTFHENMQSPSTVMTKIVLDLNSADSAQIVFVNTAAIPHSHIVQFHVNTPYIEVYNQNGDLVLVQVNPILDESAFSSSVFEVSVAVVLPPLGIVRFRVVATTSPDPTFTQFGSVTLLHGFQNQDVIQMAPFKMVEHKHGSFKLSSSYIEAEFDSSGALTSVTSLNKKHTTKVNIEFIHYGARRSPETSGAYLFLPDATAKVLHMTDKKSYGITGPLASRMVTITKFIKHYVTLFNSGGVDSVGLDIYNEVDIRTQANFELGMRITTDIDSKGTFYTDLNGFQIMKRKYQSKIPLQGNFYPVPSLLYIEDEVTRVTLASRQPLGGSSTKSGSLEVLLDRRLSQDDNRGLNQAILDNVVTSSELRLVIEQRSSPPIKPKLVSYPSLTVHHAAFSLNHPFLVLFKVEKHASKMAHSFSGTDKDLSCDVLLVNLRMSQNKSTTTYESFQPSGKTALILHRLGFDCGFAPVGLNCQTNGGKFNLGDLFSQLFSDNYQQASLTLNTLGMTLDKGYTISLNPMELYSFELSS